MLSKLCDALLEVGFSDNGPWIHKDKLNHILTKIEEAGMFPPRLPTNRIFYEPLQVAHGWEPENPDDDPNYCGAV